MWTYRHPYRPLNSTPESLRYHAQTELFRALNTGRTIAFVGSGLTIPYGRLTWRDYVRIVVLETDNKYVKRRSDPAQVDRRMDEATEIRRAIWAMLNKYESGLFRENTKNIRLDYNDDVPANVGLLQLCEDMMTALQERDFLRQVTQDIFTAGSFGKFKYRVLMLQGYGDGPELKEDGSEANKQTSLYKALLAFETIKEKQNPLYGLTFDWQAALCSLSKSLSRSEADSRFTVDYWENLEGQLFHKSSTDEPITDPIREVHDRLGIRHFLTLNYDLEIENFFYRHAFADENAYEAVSGLGKEQDAPDQTEIYRATALGGRIRSDIVGPHNLSSLSEAAILPTASNASIIHAHGSVDHPQSLIITETDYQTRYLSTNAARHAFDEALSMLFRGNHILFLGLGMSEEDVLRPLRQFMADGARHRNGGASAIALMRGERVEHKAFDLAEAEQDMETATRAIRDAEHKALAKEALNAITFFNSLGVKSYFSAQQFRIKKDSTSGQADNPVGRKPLFDQIEGLLGELDAQKNDALLIDNAIKTLERRRQRWWRYWNTKPNVRRAIFKAQDVTRDNDEHRFLRTWIRQGTNFDDDPAWPVDLVERELSKNGAGHRDETAEQGSTGSALPDSSGRVFHLHFAPGSGKGAFIRRLQLSSDKVVLAEGGSNYLSAFYADTKYSTEFNSTVFGLIRFLRGVGAWIDEGMPYDTYVDEQGNKDGRFEEISAAECKQVTPSKPIPELVEGIKPNPATASPDTVIALLELQLENVARKLREQTNIGNRLLICLSGLDRLSDSSGRLRNGLHRQVVRALRGDIQDQPSNGRRTDWPFDIFLLSSATRRPTRDPAARDEKASVKWHSVSQTGREERDWLPQCNSLEAIETAISPDPNVLERSPLLGLMDRNVIIDFWCRKYVAAAAGSDSFKAEIPRRIRQLEHEAGHGDPDAVVGGLLNAFNALKSKEDSGIWKLQLLVLRHLTLFPIPVETCVLVHCPLIADGLKSRGSEEERCRFLHDRVLADLFEIGLIVRCHPTGEPDDLDEGGKRVEPSEGGDPDITGGDRYTVHELMRAHLGKVMGYPVDWRRTSHSYDVSLYTAEAGQQSAPGRQAFLTVARIVDTLIRQTQSILEPIAEVDYYRNRLPNLVDKLDEDYIKKYPDRRRSLPSHALLFAFGLQTKDKARLLAVKEENWRESLKKKNGDKDVVRPSQTEIRAGMARAGCLHPKPGDPADPSGFDSHTEDDIRLFDDINRIARDIQKLYDATGKLKGLGTGLESPHTPTRLIRASASLLMVAFPIQTMCRLRQVDIKMFSDNAEFGKTEANQALDLYGAWIRGILNASVALGQFRAAVRRVKGAPGEPIRHPLYRSEIVWLYNERALVSHVQGKMDDALPTFKLAIDISRDAPWGEEFGDDPSSAMSSVRGIRLNQAIARMEAGNLHAAGTRLDELVALRNLRSNKKEKRPPSLILELAYGWKGVNDFYRGELKSAEVKLKSALDYLKNERGHLRAVSIFRRFLAMTWLRQGRETKAFKSIDLSIEAASAGNHRDLYHLATLAKVRMLTESVIPAREEEELSATDLIEEAESYAERMGSPRLEMLAKTTRAVSLARRRHYDQAGKLFGEAVAIARLNRLELHKAVTLSYYAKMLRARAIQNNSDDDRSFADRIERYNQFTCREMGFALAQQLPERGSV